MKNTTNMAELMKQVEAFEKPQNLDEGFASDAQRRAAFAQGYKAKGKKDKKDEEVLDEAKATLSRFGGDRLKSSIMDLAKQRGLKVKDLGKDKIEISGNQRVVMAITLAVQKKDVKINEEFDIQEDGHTDVASAIRQCKTIVEDAMQITSKLQTMNPEDSLPSWWTNKLAVSSNSMNKLRDYFLVPTTEEVELEEKSEYGPDIRGEISQLQKMLKGLERGKKTPGRGFAKMRIKELIAALEKRQAQDDAVMKLRGEEVELEEKAGDIPDLKNLVGELVKASGMHLAQSKRVQAHVDMMTKANAKGPEGAGGLADLKKIVGELQKASEAHKRQSKSIDAHIKFMGETEIKEYIEDELDEQFDYVLLDKDNKIVARASGKNAKKEMESRYRLMTKEGVRNIDGYNAKHKLPMPYIVVVVDEMSDLMLVAVKEIENDVQRLAQMARAAGIHVIMATQRPSVDVITGTIKANFPTRISFQVSSKIDSRTILGEQGGEQLLGKGDMLFMEGGGRITRIHGPFVSDEEVESVVNFLKQQGDPEYDDEVIIEREETSTSTNDYKSNSGDDLYDQAVALVARERKASTSFIQRHLKIGYNRAATIIEKMETEGVVSSSNHVGKREVLIDDHSG